MSELFRHRDDFKAVLKQLDEVFCDDVAELFAERHFSWNPVTFESSEWPCSFSPVTFKFLTRELTDSTGDSATETDSISTESELEDDSTTDHNSDSGSDLWEGFDFPQLTAEEDAELTLALQGNTSHSTIFDTGASSTATSPQEATVENSYMRSGLQGQGASELGPLSSPPPYMADFGDNSQPANRFFIDNNNRIVPTDGQIYILVDGVYHVIRQM